MRNKNPSESIPAIPKCPHWLNQLLEPIEEKAREVLINEDPFIVRDTLEKGHVVYMENVDQYRAAKTLLRASSELRKRTGELSREAAYILIEVVGNAFEIGAVKRFHDSFKNKRQGWISGKIRRAESEKQMTIIREKAKEYRQKKFSKSSKSAMATWIRKNLNPNDFIDGQGNVKIPSVGTIRQMKI